jgi:hypothetical protein
MKSDGVRPLVIGMLALQILAVVTLWILNAFSVEATAAFALLLAGDVTAFAIIAHEYRTSEDRDDKTPAA